MSNEENNIRLQVHAVAGPKVPDFKKDMHPDAIIGKLDQWIGDMLEQIANLEQVREEVRCWWEEEGWDPPFSLDGGFLEVQIEVI